MSRLVDADRLVKIIEQAQIESRKVSVLSLINDAPTVEQPIDEWCTSCKEYDKEKNCCPRFNKVIRETLKDAQPTGEWIFVKERLPEKDGDYIVYFIWNDGEEDVGKCWYNTRNGFTFDHIVAWMPLPEPPKKGGEGE